MSEDGISQLIQNLQQHSQDNILKFAKNGVLVIENFLSETQLGQVQHECRALENLSYHNKLIGNAYLTKIDPSWGQEDPRSMIEETCLGVIACDQIPKKDLIYQIYTNKKIIEEVTKIVDVARLYLYNCKLGALNISVMKEKDYLRWHFDQSDFVVSVVIQNCFSGGVFQLVKNLRSEKNPNYANVRKALLGEHRDIEELRAPEGSLIIFCGKNTLHRVTPVAGSRSRLVALLGYATKPGVCSSDHLLQIRYGRIC